MGNAAKMLRFYERKQEDERRIRNREPWTDNHQKDDILRDTYGLDFLSVENGSWGPVDYFQEIFDGKKPFFVDIKNKEFFETDNLIELNECHPLDETFIHYCSFLNGFKREKTIDQVFAFCVDLDHVDANELLKIISWKMKSKLRPTFITNSGYGLHLVYQLVQPFTRYHKDRTALNKIYRGLQAQWYAGKNDKYHVDFHGLTQGFRWPGAKNKLGRTVKVWKIGPRYNIETLATKYEVKVVGELLKYPKKSPKKTSHTEHQKKENSGLKSDVVAFPNARLYEWMKRLIYEQVNLGHRYTALFALAVCAIKSRIPYEICKEDMEEMVEDWNRAYADQPVKYSEITKALGAYKNIKESTKARRQKLEEWTGVPIQPAKRNGRSRKDHLAINNAMKSAKKKMIVKLYFEANPGAGVNQITQASGLNKRTVSKYAKELGLGPFAQLID